MTDCEGGYNKFGHLYAPEYREERDRLQKRFITIILESDIHPVAGGIVMADYSRLLPRLKLIRRDPRYAKSPYFLSFEHCLLEMCKRASFLSNTGEQIAFVFDRQKECCGRAKELYEQTIKLDNASYAKSLGPLAFGAKSGPGGYVSLQAADVFVYEAYRYRGDHKIKGEPLRWQMQMLLSHPNGLTGRFFDAESLESRLVECGC
jgi:hypothetical protein